MYHVKMKHTKSCKFKMHHDLKNNFSHKIVVINNLMFASCAYNDNIAFMGVSVGSNLTLIIL